MTRIPKESKSISYAPWTATHILLSEVEAGGGGGGGAGRGWWEVCVWGGGGESVK